MKVAILSAFVCGAIAVAGASAPALGEQGTLEGSKRVEGESSNARLIKRGEGQMGEAFAHAFTNAIPEGETSAKGAANVARGPTNYVFNEASHAGQMGSAAGGVDNVMMAKILKNQKKLKNMYEQDRQAEQLHALQAQRLNEESVAARQAAAAPAVKKGGTWMKTKITGGLVVGGIGGYALTKMLTTKPADTTTQMNPADAAALSAAGGSGTPGAANAAAAGTGGGYGPGIYTDPKTGIQYQVDAAGNVSLVPSAGAGAVGTGISGATGAIAGTGGTGAGAGAGIVGQGGIVPATSAGTSQVPATSGPGLYMDKNTGLQYYVDSTGKMTPAGVASSAGTSGSTVPASGAATGINTVNNPVDGAVAQTGTPGATAGVSGVAGPAGSTSNAAQPQWDPQMNMYYVMAQDGTPYYIETSSHMLINGKTGQIVDPQTGQVVDPNTLTGASTAPSSNPATGGNNDAPGTPNSGGPPHATVEDAKTDGSPKSDKFDADKKPDSKPDASNVDPKTDAAEPKTDATGGNKDTTGPSSKTATSGQNMPAFQKRFLRKRQTVKRGLPLEDVEGLTRPLTQNRALGPAAGELVPATAVAKPMSKKKLGLMIGGGIVAVLGTVLALDNVAHPKLSGTTPANPYGLQATKYCNAYGVPFVVDHWGTVWDKSTYTKVDPQNPPTMSLCSDATGGAVGGGAAPLGFAAPATGSVAHRKRALIEKRAPLGWTYGGVAVVGGAAMYVTYLDKLHKQKEKAQLEAYNSEYHTAGDAASSQGNSITTGAAGQLFNPMSGNLVLVDANSGQTYDSGTGEAVNSQTGLPLAYSATTSSNPTNNGASSGTAATASISTTDATTNGDGFNASQIEAEWNAKSPEEQQRLLAQYGVAANAIASSPDTNAALNQYKAQLLNQSTSSTPLANGSTLPSTR